VAGMFISRHDMILAYILLGWTSALWIQASYPRTAAHHSKQF
jgi:hypothetical protein